MVLKSLDNHSNSANNKLQLTIHPTAFGDTQSVSVILAKSFYNFPEFASWIYPFLQFTINEDLRYRLRNRSPDYCCFVAKIIAQDSSIEQDETTHDDSTPLVVGTIEIGLRSPSLWSSSVQYPYISNLAVHQNYRRLGIGSRLLAKCERTALEWGYLETRLHVLNSNDSAKQLYCSNGYQISQIESGLGSLWFDYSPRLLLKKQIQAY